MQSLEDKYKPLIEAFVSDLMAHEGCYVRVPMPLHKGTPPDDYEETKIAVWSQTCDLLGMMGISYQSNITSKAIMIVPEDGDWQSDFGPKR